MAKLQKPNFFRISITSNDNDKVVLNKGFTHKEAYKADMLKSIWGEELISNYVESIIGAFRKLDLALISEKPNAYKSGNISNIDFDKFTLTLTIHVNGSAVISKTFRTAGFTNETRRQIDLTACIKELAKDLNEKVIDSVNYDYNLSGDSKFDAYQAYSIPSNYFNKKWRNEMFKANQYANSNGNVYSI